MRLSRWNREEWTRLAPYIDTLCLPVYSIRFRGKQPDIGQAQRVRAVAEEVERRLTGRMLLLPGIAYAGTDAGVRTEYVKRVVEEFVDSAFHYLMLIASEHLLPKEVEETDIPLSIFLLEVPHDAHVDDCAAEFSSRVTRLWEFSARE